MSDLSNRILRLIEDKGLSYGELAEMTNIPKSALQRYATGETEKIPLPRIEIIANALGVSSAYLIGWDSAGEQEPNNEKQPSVSEELSDIAMQIAKMVDRLPPESRQLLLVQVRALAQGVQDPGADGRSPKSL